MCFLCNFTQMHFDAIVCQIEIECSFIFLHYGTYVKYMFQTLLVKNCFKFRLYSLKLMCRYGEKTLQFTFNVRRANNSCLCWFSE